MKMLKVTWCYILVGLLVAIVSDFSVSASESCCKFKLQQQDTEPQWIQDPNAIAPPSWQGEPQWIDDPNDVKPEGWDDEDDGDWMPVRILNPGYSWEPPQILNPNYVPPPTYWEKFEVEVKAAFPWVNVGVLFTGLLSSIPLPLDVFQKWLHPLQSESTSWQWFTHLRTLSLASLLGLAVPLCSCGALPLCVGLMSQGIPLSTAMAFLTASQSAGLDSAAITYGLLGAQAMVGRLLCAILLGLSVGLVCPNQPAGTAQVKKTCNPTTIHSFSLRILSSALLSTYVEIYPTVLLGLAMSTAALHFLPNLLRYDHHTSTTYLLLTKLTVVGSAVPLQLCEHTAVTLASAIQRAGGSPGLAFSFLVSAPATNMPSLLFLWSHSGLVAVLKCVVALVALSVTVAQVLDSAGYDLLAGETDENGPMKLPKWLNDNSLYLAGALFILGCFQKYLWTSSRGKEGGCCSSKTKVA